MNSESTLVQNTPATIWNRLIRPDMNDMSPEAARFFLSLAFDSEDLRRLHELTVKNQSGTLATEEAEELKTYRQVGLELDLLHAKARRALKRKDGAKRQ